MENQEEKLLLEAQKQLEKYNQAIRNGRTDISAKLFKKAQEAAWIYVGYECRICYSRFLAAPDPMLIAVRELTYPDLSFEDQNCAGGTRGVKKLVPITHCIDLLELHKKGKGIGKKADWVSQVSKFNLLLTIRRCGELGIEPETVNNSHEMRQILNAINEGKTPTSNTQLLKSLQLVVDSMIGEEYKVFSHDVSFLVFAFSSLTKNALVINCANQEFIHQCMAEVCHRIVTKHSSEVEFK